MYWCTTDIKYSIEYYPVNFMSKWEAGANFKWDLISELLFKWWDFWMSYFKLFIFKTFGPLSVWGSWLWDFNIPNLIEKYSNFYGPFAIFIAQFAMWIDLDGRDSWLPFYWIGLDCWDGWLPFYTQFEWKHNFWC